MHKSALKRILRYVKGTAEYRILYTSNEEEKFAMYSDSDYAGEVETRRSTSGFAFMINNSIVSWSSERQKCVSLSEFLCKPIWKFRYGMVGVYVHSCQPKME